MNAATQKIHRVGRNAKAIHISCQPPLIGPYTEQLWTFVYYLSIYGTLSKALQVNVQIIVAESRVGFQVLS